MDLNEYEKQLSRYRSIKDLPEDEQKTIQEKLTPLQVNFEPRYHEDDIETLLKKRI